MGLEEAWRDVKKAERRKRRWAAWQAGRGGVVENKQRGMVERIKKEEEGIMRKMHL